MMPSDLQAIAAGVRPGSDDDGALRLASVTVEGKGIGF